MAYQPSLEDGILGFENSFLKFHRILFFHLKILYFCREQFR